MSLNSVSASYFWDPFWDPSNLVEAVRNEAGSTLLRVFEAFSVTHKHTSDTQTNAHKLFRNRGCWLESALILRAQLFFEGTSGRMTWRSSTQNAKQFLETEWCLRFPLRSYGPPMFHYRRTYMTCTKRNARISGPWSIGSVRKTHARSSLSIRDNLLNLNTAAIFEAWS